MGIYKRLIAFITYVQNTRSTDKALCFMEEGYEAQGSYSHFFKIDQYKGVKVLRTSFYTEEKLKKSGSYKDALKEIEWMDKAFVTGLVPKCYGITTVRVGKYYRAGIIMEYLGNVRLDDYVDDPFEKDQIFHEMQQTLLKIGICINDIHGSNVMVKDGKHYLIDFTPWYVDEVNVTVIAA